MTLPKKLKQLFLSKSFWIAAAAVVSFGPIYERLPVRIDGTLDRSLPYHVWITYSDFNDTLHRYAVFVPPVHNRYTRHVRYLVKEIGCLPGQRLVVSGRDCYCDGRFLGRALERGSDGRRVEQFEYNGTVPAGEYFMVGTHPHSYDSRYFGLVKRSSIVRGARPIW